MKYALQKYDLIEYIKNLLGENDLLFHRFKKSILEDDAENHTNNLEILCKKYDYEVTKKINDAFFEYVRSVNYDSNFNFYNITKGSYFHEYNLEFNPGDYKLVLDTNKESELDNFLLDNKDEIIYDPNLYHSDLNSKSWLDILNEDPNTQLTHPSNIIDDIFKK